MHFLKRAALFSVFLMLVLSLSACSSRTAVTEDAFTAAMDKLGFTDQTPEDGSASSAGVVTMRLYSSPTDGGAVYYVYEDSVTAHQSYADIVSSISQQGKKVKQVDSATYNFAQFESSSGGTYCAIRTDSTLLYLADSTETFKALLTELGY